MVYILECLKPVVLTSDLHINFNISFPLKWGIIVDVGLASYPIDSVRRGMMITSGEAVKYKSSMDAFHHEEYV